MLLHSDISRHYFTPQRIVFSIPERTHLHMCSEAFLVIVFFTDPTILHYYASIALDIYQITKSYIKYMYVWIAIYTM